MICFLSIGKEFTRIELLYGIKMKIITYLIHTFHTKVSFTTKSLKINMQSNVTFINSIFEHMHHDVSIFQGTSVPHNGGHICGGTSP